MTETFPFRSVLPPGPAFIPFDHYLWGPPHKIDVKSKIILRAHGVPKGYVFQPATDHTMAGWVRARRITTAPPEAVP